jgi:peroxiredoxin
VLAASIQGLETSREMAERLDVAIPILADTSREVAKAFGIYNLPGSMGPFSTHSFWLLDREGRIRFSRVSLEMHVPLRDVERAVADLASASAAR